MLDKNYDHGAVEAKWHPHVSHSSPANPLESEFIITLPPPNVTGDLHMGHALNATLQDVLVRYHRLRGRSVHWQIGVDHAGIGTQAVVEKQLASEGTDKHAIGREAFDRRIREWAQSSRSNIFGQLQRLGASVDWSRTTFTLDPSYERAVRETFWEWFGEGLIYRGKRLVNWCPVSLTTLSDLEVKHQETNGTLYHLRYPLVEPTTDRALIVATSRPETLYGDVAVAINPDDERYRELVQEIEAGGKVLVELPMTGVRIPIILSERVKTDFGTGALKITPAHDFNDQEIAQAWNRSQMGRTEPLPTDLNVFSETATLLPLERIPEEMHGLGRFEARKATVKALEASGYLVERQQYRQTLSLNGRSDAQLEPRLSEQWFVDMDKLATLATEAVESGAVRFRPERYADGYLSWLRDVRDWCISRQLWWGHRIPVWQGPPEKLPKEMRERDGIWVREQAEGTFVCMREADEALEARLAEAGFQQDPDVLDTWFSSALWPLAAQGWPEANLPENRDQWSDVLITARDIINLWVARMVYASRHLTGKLPFREVLIHPVIQTPDGKRMSKSKGTGVDPLQLIDRYGADGCRMWFASVGIFGQQDVRFPGRQHKDGIWSSAELDSKRRFLNKVWNAARFVLSKADRECDPEGTAATWIWHRWNRTLANVQRSMADYRFGDYVRELEHFLRDEYCDWYLEMIKLPELDTEASRGNALRILREAVLALHPVAPFATSELLEQLGVASAETTLPDPRDVPGGEAATQTVRAGVAVIEAVRNLRQEVLGLPGGEVLTVQCRGGDHRSEPTLPWRPLAKAQAPEERGRPDARRITKDLPEHGFRVTVEVPEHVDLASRGDVLRQARDRKRCELDKLLARADKPAFRENADPEVVAEIDRSVTTCRQQLENISQALEQVEQASQT